MFQDIHNILGRIWRMDIQTQYQQKCRHNGTWCNEEEYIGGMYGDGDSNGRVHEQRPQLCRKWMARVRGEIEKDAKV